MNADYRYLAFFPGPKAENSNLLESLVSSVLKDNIDWRRSYYPDDSKLTDSSSGNSLQNERALLEQNVGQMMKAMRKNLPFHSPRYIAHMLSDTSLPALIGYIAGLLYNPNNVTTEAAPVTVDWEIQACNKVLEMLGYVKPPKSDADDINFDMEQYNREVEKTFGWAHITFGGTSSNIEALWVARNVKYMALAIRDAAQRKHLDIPVRQANGTIKNITDFDEREILLIRPEDSIYLLTDYFKAVYRQSGSSKCYEGSPEEKAWEWINESEFSLSKGTSSIFRKYPPVIFVSGASHYSIDKAADILGVGKENIQRVKMDSRFRMDVKDLEKKIKRVLLQGKIPLAVIGIAGTTEEGAVDPIHDIVNLRSGTEANNNASFWLHVDAAWGGYIRTLFAPMDIMDTFIHISKQLNLTFDGNISKWNELFFSRIEKDAANLLTNAVHPGKRPARGTREINAINGLMESRDEFARLAGMSDIEAYFRKINYFNAINQGLWVFSSPNTFNISQQDRINLITALVSGQIEIEYGNYRKESNIHWSDNSVLSSYLSFPYADSITVDAHKMGYVPYSCGLVAYKNDRIRNFIYQKAPYITGMERKSLAHYPPKHIIKELDWAGTIPESKYKTIIESFAPFTLEGSKSGASACSLWMATKTIPLTFGCHGSIIKSSLLATRELYEWLSCWNQISTGSSRGKNAGYEFIPLSKTPPDTNVVTFIVKNNKLPTLAAANRLTMQVYKNFALPAEDNTGRVCCEQPFFLSKTEFKSPLYPFSTLRDFCKNSRIENSKEEYDINGLFVIRITVMNPYIYPINKKSSENYFKEFMETISQAAEECICDLEKVTWQ